jgi:hypothetical protein
MPRRFQFSLTEAFLVTAVIGGFALAIVKQSEEIAFITLAAILPMSLHRPVVLRIWIAAMVGVGAAMLASVKFAGSYRDDMATWGAGLLAAGISSYPLFILSPPDRHGD